MFEKMKNTVSNTTSKVSDYLVDNQDELKALANVMLVAAAGALAKEVVSHMVASYFEDDEETEE
jgi:hypothetical protein